ncbi:hypothetical protein BKA82DRAFT_994399 [Pisolithus tinctorius]|uniref:GST N-terminal domain-containing protein n=1 Tax=Pisolithus tinctorius Marx 270 TaxID=870435 RepID=A0A0C3PD31_PISTI|nr:hypothetical protein BKA82DRAFT_994399 [Pisolithus tinctorius]KIO11680.1 hypothetical protein M404DRAFT_994399 [Pisolithus tinctorius Marx 270]
MMSFTVIGTPFSTFTRTITLGLHYKGLPFNQISVLPHSETADEYHPFGYLPTLAIETETGGKEGTLKLRESLAIVRYFDRVAPQPTLCISAGDGRALIEEQMWEFVSMVASYGFPAIEFGVVKPRMALTNEGKATDAEIRESINTGVSRSRRFLTIIEEAMSPEGYAFGEKLSWADFFLYPLLADLRAIPEGELLSERMLAWMELMDKLEAVKATTPGTLSAGARPS